MRVLIVGAGIGGLTTALSLHEDGFKDLYVVEGRSAPSELGVALNLLPHAMREYSELGVVAAISAMGAPIESLGYYSRQGLPIMQEARGLAAGYHWPQIAIRRSALQDILLSAVVERLGPNRIHFGTWLQGLSVDSAGYSAILEPGGGMLPSFGPKDLIIACDGLHSWARDFLFPDQPAPRWNGITMWRGISSIRSFLDGRSMAMIGSLAKRFVVYPASAPCTRTGLQDINWVAEIRGDATTLPAWETWRVAHTVEDALHAFGDMPLDFIDVKEVMRCARQVFAFPMLDRDPLSRWTSDNVTLLGDAAHPMLPVGSNGASQAVFDARTLACSLRRMPSAPRGALLDYEVQRRPAVNALVLANREAGPEHCMELVAERAPHGFVNVHDVVNAEETFGRVRRYQELAGFAVEQLNSRASLAV